MTRDERAILYETPGVRRVLFLRGLEVVELWIEGVDAPSLIGGVALVTARAAGGAAIAALPTVVGPGSNPGIEGYIRDGRPGDGERVVVQVASDSGTGKRPVLRQRVELASEHTLLTPERPGLGLSSSITGKVRRAALRDAVSRVLPDDLGAVVRAGGADRAPEALAGEVDASVGLWRQAMDAAAKASPPAWLIAPPDFQTRVVRHAPAAELVVDPDGTAFEAADGDAVLEVALARRVPLTGLGELVFDRTEAATLVDVNLATSPRGDALLRANRRVVRETVRQARLRGLRGIVLIDLPRMTGRRARDSVLAAFTEAVAQDPTPWQVLGWTPGGMLECVREGARASLADEMLVAAAPSALTARARAWSALLRLRRERRLPARPVLRVAGDVAAWLLGPGAAIVAAERRRLGALSVMADPTIGPDELWIDSEA